MANVPDMNNSTELPERLARVVADPRSYANWDALHEDLKIIRREHPFARAQIDGYNPFWVASRFDDIRAIALNNEVFRSGMGGILSNEEVAFERRAGIGGLVPECRCDERTRPSQVSDADAGVVPAEESAERRSASACAREAACRQARSDRRRM